MITHALLVVRNGIPAWPDAVCAAFIRVGAFTPSFRLRRSIAMEHIMPQFILSNANRRRWMLALALCFSLTATAQGLPRAKNPEEVGLSSERLRTQAIIT